MLEPQQFRCGFFFSAPQMTWVSLLLRGSESRARPRWLRQFLLTFALIRNRFNAGSCRAYSGRPHHFRRFRMRHERHADIHQTLFPWRSLKCWSSLLRI
jgi:hypothetical protein